jgi:hypothetical protein
MHRDLHPSNIIVAPDGSVHIIDFAWATVPGSPEIGPEAVGLQVEQPASARRFSVRPTGVPADDLVAVGRIVAWLERSDDPELGLLAAWLTHADDRLRLVDERLALELVQRLVQVRVERNGAGGPSDRVLDTELARLAWTALRQVERLEVADLALRAELDKLGGQLARYSQDLASTRRQLDDVIYWRNRSRFWQAHERWFDLKRRLGLMR